MNIEFYSQLSQVPQGGAVVNRARPAALFPIAQTKLHPPLPRIDGTARSRIMGLLQNLFRTYPVILISAPAGSGKTTAGAAFAAHSREMPLAWLSLDEQENGLERLIAAVIMALRQISPHLGEQLLPYLGERGYPGEQAEAVVSALINEILAHIATPFLLVLDDLHRLADREAMAALSYLLERMPPHMHVVLISRNDPPLPLARLRVRRRLAEVRLSDLRFTPAEMSEFFQQTLGLSLTAEQTLAVQERTEGWAAGLALLANTLAQTETARYDDLASVLARADQEVYSYLAEEVWACQGEETARFLVQTAILPELTPALCAAVTGDPEAHALLERIYRENLFMAGLGGREPSYRYHDLFRAFLLRKLEQEGAERVRELHGRAAAAEARPQRRIHHLLAAERWDEAARALVHMARGPGRIASLEAICRWAEQLPEETAARYPYLQLVKGLHLHQRWEYTRAIPLLEAAAQRLIAADDAEAAGQALVNIAHGCAFLNDYQRAGAAAREALSCPLSRGERARLLWLLESLPARVEAGPVTHSRIDEALHLAEGVTDPDEMAQLINQFQLHPPFTLSPGMLGHLERYRQVARRILPEGPTPLAATIDAVTALLQMWRGEWGAAIEAGERALANSSRFGHLRWIDIGIGVMIALLRAYQGGGASAAEELAGRIAWLERDSGSEAMLPHRMTGLLYLQGKLSLQTGRVDEARAILQRLRAMESRLGPTARYAAVPALEVLLNALDGSPGDPAAALRFVVEGQERRAWLIEFSSARVIVAFALLRRGRTDEAMAHLKVALGQYEREGAPGAILWEGPEVAVPLLKEAVRRSVCREFAAQCLALLGVRPAEEAVVVPETGGSLTQREVEVLRLIARGRSNQEIGAELYLSLHTVKRHVANLLGKLGAASRTEAVARGRDLGIL